MKGKYKNMIVYAAIGLIPVGWLALLLAPHLERDGLFGMIAGFGEAIEHPMRITVTEGSGKAVLFFIMLYAVVLAVFFSTLKNYRPGVEHGSAKWGDAKGLNAKYAGKVFTDNKILTQNVRIGFNTRAHRRNIHVLVCGGSGSGKTRYYAKVNVLQANTSMVILDPKGELIRDTGHLLARQGYEVRVLDLLNMDRSHCYNPFTYLDTDNDVQRLVTNLFKATTPKGAVTQDPFWGATRS